MENDLDKALEVDVLAAALKQDNQDSLDLLEFLAQKLELSLPQNTTVARGGWFLSKKRPVTEIILRFEDYHYKIIRQENGSLLASSLKIVSGVALKTSIISLEQWTEEIAKKLVQLSSSSGQTLKALNKFVLGGD
jgi:hypothetical protein